jgi:hypothetical protein
MGANIMPSGQFFSTNTRRFHVLEPISLSDDLRFTVPFWDIYLDYTLEHAVFHYGTAQKEVVDEVVVPPRESLDFADWVSAPCPSLYETLGAAHTEFEGSGHPTLACRACAGCSPLWSLSGISAY